MKQTQEKLISSIPANNQKIIEIYQKLQAGRLNVSPDFQRKLVWRRQHKIEFIETILKNYPFPEVYLAPEKVDTQRMELRELVVDGQQRLSAIKEYIAGTGVFAQPSSIPTFDSLDTSQKEDFLNYEVSVRYLKNASEEQIKEIFQRINRTDYSLNRMERFHAAWGDSELVCLAKQLVDRDLEINLELINYRVEDADRNWLLEFFGAGSDDGMFSEAEVSRMQSLQYILVLLITMIRGAYFHRNTVIEEAVKTYYEQVPDAQLHVKRLVDSTRFISELQLPPESMWTTKSSLFTMMVELANANLAAVDKVKLRAELLSIEEKLNANAAIDEDSKQYKFYTREAVNEKKGRELRGKYFNSIVMRSI
ncbi:DUF262 domain-containing protein [Hydrogenophaga luteola]|uniref:DUF262 domain-containing protein n=1 Tax=Hydrogenophaga luteola TaxID=1591122 RepID=A0ABV7W7M5_9BURK